MIGDCYYICGKWYRITGIEATVSPILHRFYMKDAESGLEISILRYSLLPSNDIVLRII